MINSMEQDMERQLHSRGIEAEVVVVGAGIAGISAALAAARQGRETVLITDRPIPGGSASSEIRVGPGGADAPVWNRYARETGIVEEIFNHIYYKAQNAGKWRWFYFDQIYFDLLLSQPRLRLFLNTSVFAAETDGQCKITAVKGLQLRSETVFTFSGKMFIDCTGDGTLGFLSGAHFRMGREGKEEFGEYRAPEKPDRGTMGATLLFTSVVCHKPVAYHAPEWAIKVPQLPTFPRIQKYINKMPDGSYYGFWWVEYGGQLDSVHDDGEVLLHLRRLVAGLWDYIKNSGDFPDVEKHEMNWMGYLAGKRESRRLIGPYIATSDDFKNQREFEDAVGYVGWPIDIHPPEGYLSPEEGCGCTHDILPGPADFPFRCIYSVNIPNLLFAGRHPSCTHEALGTLRLIPTTGEMGQAAGIAAAICIENGFFPAELSRQAMPELQRRLLRTDQTIWGRPLREAGDISRTARVSASSEDILENAQREHFRFLKQSVGLILPVEETFEGIYLYLSADAPARATVDFYTCDGVPQNYRAKEKAASSSCTVEKEGWYWFDAPLQGLQGGKIFILLHGESGIRVYYSYRRLTGVLGITCAGTTLGYDSPYEQINGGGYISLLPCFRVKNPRGFYSPQNVNNGFMRVYGALNLWRSAAFDGHGAEWLRLDFDKKHTVSRIELVLNSDLNHKRLQPTIDAVSPELLKDFALYAVTEDGERLLHCQKENFQRFLPVDFPAVEATGVLLKAYGTWGYPHAEVFDLRVYGPAPETAKE